MRILSIWCRVRELHHLDDDGGVDLGIDLMWDDDKSTRGNVSQFFVAGELCRRGHSAVVTLGNSPNTDILCSNLGGTKFVHIQVKTFIPGISRTCSVGLKATMDFGENFFGSLLGFLRLSRRKHSNITSSRLPRLP